MVIIALIWIIVVALTVGVYMLVFPVYNTLFGINLAIAIFAETLVLYCAKVLPSENELTPQRVSQRIVLFVYAVLLFIWTTGFTLTHPIPPYSTLFVGLAVITIGAVLFLGFSALGNQAIDKQESAIVQKAEVKQTVLLPISNWRFDVENNLPDDDSEWYSKVVSDIRNIEDRIKTIPTNKLSLHPEFVDYINKQIQDVTSMVTELTDRQNSNDIKEQISKKIGIMRKYVANSKQNF